MCDWRCVYVSFMRQCSCECLLRRLSISLSSLQFLLHCILDCTELYCCMSLNVLRVLYLVFFVLSCQSSMKEKNRTCKRKLRTREKTWETRASNGKKGWGIKDRKYRIVFVLHTRVQRMMASPSFEKASFFSSPLFLEFPGNSAALYSLELRVLFLVTSRLPFQSLFPDKIPSKVLLKPPLLRFSKV